MNENSYKIWLGLKNMELKDLAIIDLHLHLDGALSPEIIIERAMKENIDLPTYNKDELRKYLEVSKHCESLNEYLTKFDIPNLVLQTKEGIFECTLDLLHRLSLQGLKYVEIRMAPQLSTAKGLSQEEVVIELINSSQRAENLYGISSNIILCMMRGDTNRTKNLETIDVAYKYLNKGVVALDLAGAEALFPNELFKEEFNRIKELGIPLTIHAGEASGSESVRSAINFGAVRIGHGVHAIEDMELMCEIVGKRISLEICPTSNLDTKAVSNLDEIPVKKFLELGVKVTINTDDPTVSNTTLLDQYKLLENIGLSKEELKTIALNSIEAAFINNEKKEELKSFLPK